MPDKIGKLTLVRHGETTLNEHNHTRGWVNVPLNEHGVKQAVQASKVLKAGPKVDSIASSDLKRSVQTSAILRKGQAHRPPISLHPELRPWNIGTYAAKPIEKVLKPMQALEQPHNEKLPAPGGESFRAFKERYLPFLQDKMQEARDSGKHIVLSTHHRNLLAAKSWIDAGMSKDLNFPPPKIDSKQFRTSAHYDIPPEVLKKA